jgi:hypothetical protein
MEWGQFAILLIALLGMFIWLKQDIALNRSEASADRRDSAADRRDILNLIRTIQEEIKDFHGKLERQDAEFKGRLALQDQEFKNHIIHMHKEGK